MRYLFPGEDFRSNVVRGPADGGLSLSIVHQLTREAEVSDLEAFDTTIILIRITEGPEQTGLLHLPCHHHCHCMSLMKRQYLDPAVLIKEQVGELEIPVDDAVLVEALNGQDGLPQQVRGLGVTQPPAAPQQVRQGPPAAALEQQVHVLGVLERVQELDDARVLEAPVYGDLRLELLPRPRLLQRHLADCLQTPGSRQKTTIEDLGFTYKGH